MVATNKPRKLITIRKTDSTLAIAIQGDIMESVKFDYANQAWLRDSGNGLRYIRCGHPETKNCDCFGKVFEGFTQHEAAEILSQAAQLGRTSAQAIESERAEKITESGARLANNDAWQTAKLIAWNHSSEVL